MSAVTVTKNRENKCPIFYAFTKKGDCVPVRCGLWACPECAKINAKKWAWRVQLHIERRKLPTYMITLTVRGYIKDVPYAFRMLPKWWDVFRKRMQRELTGKWEYCAFVEAQALNRSGMPHFHIISLRIPKRQRIKDFAWECGFGYEADIKKVNSGKASSYVAKYASKGDPSMPRDFRRVRTSQGWTKLPELDEQNLIVKSQKETITEYLIRVADVVDLSLDELLRRWHMATL